MNTPRTKPPVRYSNRPKRTFSSDIPDPAAFSLGVGDPEILTLIGRIATEWPHVEERMIDIMRTLLGGRRDMPAKEIFRSIVSQEARIKLMLSLLQSEMNEKQPEFIDRCILAFQSLNGSRNSYIHGLWLHNDQGTYITDASPIDGPFGRNTRTVKKEELERFLDRMRKLSSGITAYYFLTDTPPHPSKQFQEHLEQQVRDVW